MTTNKKVILFIVEGHNDETALAASLENIISTDYVKFEITGGDITSDYYGKDIAARVGDCVRLYCENSNYQRDDFVEVVLLVDMDGAYIDDALIKESADDDKAYYFTDKILHVNPDILRKTHEVKRRNLSRLIPLPKVYRSVPFSVYFFSCNLDHIICDDANLAQEKKRKAAAHFRRQYHANPAGFVKFFHDEDISVGNTYNDSWNHIKRDVNSLKRCSNFNIYLSPEAAHIPRDFSGLLDADKEGE